MARVAHNLLVWDSCAIGCGYESGSQPVWAYRLRQLALYSGQLRASQQDLTHGVLAQPPRLRPTRLVYLTEY